MCAEYAAAFEQHAVTGADLCGLLQSESRLRDELNIKVWLHRRRIVRSVHSVLPLPSSVLHDVQRFVLRLLASNIDPVMENDNNAFFKHHSNCWYEKDSVGSALHNTARKLLSVKDASAPPFSAQRLFDWEYEYE